jgi:paraquat-inducible protein B
MARRANAAIIGAFVVGALVLLVAGALALGAGRWLSGDLRFVLSFREPVTGLIVGSPVEFRGVKVGEVDEIRAIYDAKGDTFHFPVNIKLRSDRIERLGSGKTNLGAQELANTLVERGLRARLETQSFVTGQKRIALDFFPDKEATYAGPVIAQNQIELPTVASQTEDIANLLRNIPFERLGRDLMQVVDGLKQLVGPGREGEVRPLSDLIASLQASITQLERGMTPLIQDSRATLATLRETLAHSRTAIAQAESSLKSIGTAASGVETVSTEARAVVQEAQAAIKQMSAGLEHAGAALKNLDALTAEDSAVLHDVTVAARELGSAGRALRSLAEDLRAQPDALVRGRVANKAP